MKRFLSVIAFLILFSCVANAHENDNRHSHNDDDDDMVMEMSPTEDNSTQTEDNSTSDNSTPTEDNSTQPEGKQTSTSNSNSNMSMSNTHNSAFEGIWHVDGMDKSWVSITVSGSEIILIKYEPGTLSEALAGQLTGGIAWLGFATDAHSFDASLTLVTSTTANLSVVSCFAKLESGCAFPGGSEFSITKVFE